MSENLKRKHRFTAEIVRGNKTILKPTFIKVNMPLSGYTDNSQISFTIMNADDRELVDFYGYLSEIYDLGKKNKYSSNPEDMYVTIFLRQHNGIGELIDSAEIPECWPISINFGELSHSATEPAEIEIIWKVNLKN